jgi:hypothetical protein
VKTHHSSWEQLREEPLEVAQKGTFALYASELLEERQGYDLRVRELLERLVAVRVGIEEGIGVVGEAKKHGYRLFQGGEGGSMLRVSHPRFLSLGFGWLLFYRQSTQQASSNGAEWENGFDVLDQRGLFTGVRGARLWPFGRQG